MAIYIKEIFRNPLVAARCTYDGIRGKIQRLNPGQKRVFLSLVFFLLVNATILVVSIVVFSLLLKKL